MGTKLLVVSFDAMVTEDIPVFAEHPVFAEFFDGAAGVPSVRSIYPTVTYPAHTTIATGCWPDRHGVTANEPFLPGISPLPWNFYHDIVRCPDIFDLCKQNGLRCAAVGWPVTGNHPSIDLLVDEIWTIGRDWTRESMREVLIGSGTDPQLYEKIVRPLESLRVPRRQPASSFFNAAAAAGILSKYRPDVLFVHLGNPDNYRHKAGVFSPLIKECAADLAGVFFQLQCALRENGDLEDCNIVLLSDHGQLDTKRSVYPNVALRKKGYITAGRDGKLLDWKIWCHNTGMSVQVYLKDPDDPALRKEAEEVLKDLVQQEDSGFAALYTAEECAAKEHLGGGFSFVLETDGETFFGDRCTGAYMDPVPETPYGRIHGSHGHHPDKGPQPVFFAKGPAFRCGAALPHADLIDEAPTIAASLGLSMPGCDGRVLTELLA